MSELRHYNYATLAAIFTLIAAHDAISCRRYAAPPLADADDFRRCFTPLDGYADAAFAFVITPPTPPHYAEIRCHVIAA